LGRYSAAVETQREALRLSQQIGRPRVASRSYVILGVMCGDQGDYREGARNVVLGKEVAEKITSESTRNENLAYAFLKLADLHRRGGNPQEAIAEYDQALRLYSEIGSPAFAYLAHKGRLQVYIALGDGERVERETEVTIGLFEQYRSKVVEQANRDSLFDAEQGIYDIAVDFAYSILGDPGKAFEYSERCRAASAIDVAAEEDRRFDSPGSVNMPRRPANAGEIGSRLPEQSQVLEYAVLNDKLLVWLLSRTRFECLSVRIPAEELNGRVREYLSRLSTPSESDGNEATSSSQALYDILLRPVEAKLDRNKQVCVVPDKNLGSLPFAALRSSVSGKYLVEEY